MTRNFNNIVVTDSDTEVYKSVDDYFKAKGLNRFKQHEECFKNLINDIGFDKCKRILFEYVHTSELLFDYKQDKYFNQSKLQRIMSLDYFTNLYANVCPTKWDEIGHRMLYTSPKLYFRAWSLCDLTCLAKACAKMVVHNYKKG